MDNSLILTNLTGCAVFNMQNSTIVDWFIGIGTISLALFASISLISGYVKNKWFGPKLNISIKVEPPDCHKTTLNVPVVKVGERTIQVLPISTYYCRLKVENIGKSKAEKIELMISNLYKKNKNSYEKVREFTPLNLKWSYFGTPIVDLLPNMFKHCDLMNIIRKLDLDKLYKDIPSHISSNFGSANSLIIFNFITQLNTYDNIKEPGEYAIELLVSFSRCRDKLKKYYSIELKNAWTNDEPQMLAENIIIKSIDRIN